MKQTFKIIVLTAVIAASSAYAQNERYKGKVSLGITAGQPFGLFLGINFNKFVELNLIPGFSFYGRQVSALTAIMFTLGDANFRRGFLHFQIGPVVSADYKLPVNQNGTTIPGKFILGSFSSFQINYTFRKSPWRLFSNLGAGVAVDFLSPSTNLFDIASPTFIAFIGVAYIFR